MAGAEHQVVPRSAGWQLDGGVGGQGHFTLGLTQLLFQMFLRIGRFRRCFGIEDDHGPFAEHLQGIGMAVSREKPGQAVVEFRQFRGVDQPGQECRAAGTDR